jgi:hypothetical protein
MLIGHLPYLGSGSVAGELKPREIVNLDPVTILDHFSISRYNRPVVRFLVSMQAEV